MFSTSGADDAHVIVVRDTHVLVKGVENAPSFPTLAELGPWLAPEVVRYPVGQAGSRAVYAVASGEPEIAAAGFCFVPVRSLFGVLDAKELDLVGRCLSVVDFETTHRFCGRCAAPTVAIAVERGKRCERCELSFYPRIPPAVITLIEDEGRILLARSARFKTGMFSAVAGFVEIGESLEHAAIREVREEVGVHIGDLRYFGSQPWPFGRSLMVGFFGRYLGGDVVVDGTEIVEAAWFDIAHLPLLPPPISIARKLIENFVARQAC